MYIQTSTGEAATTRLRSTWTWEGCAMTIAMNPTMTTPRAAAMPICTFFMSTSAGVLTLGCNRAR